MGFVSQIRAQEIKILKQIAIVSSVGSFIMVFAPFLVSLTSYAFFVKVLNRQLTATIIFVSMTLFNLLRFPLSMLPTVISAVVQLQVSQKRIDTFLNAEELDPDGVTRLPRDLAAGAGPKGSQQIRKRFMDKNTTFPRRLFSLQLFSVHLDYLSIITETADDFGINVDSATFSWVGDSAELTLRDLSFNMPQKSLFAVVGKIGSGKSSLLSAICGEVHKVSGSVIVKVRDNSKKWQPQSLF